MRVRHPVATGCRRTFCHSATRYPFRRIRMRGPPNHDSHPGWSPITDDRATDDILLRGFGDTALFLDPIMLPSPTLSEPSWSVVDTSALMRSRSLLLMPCGHPHRILLDQSPFVGTAELAARATLETRLGDHCVGLRHQSLLFRALAPIYRNQTSHSVSQG